MSNSSTWQNIMKKFRNDNFEFTLGSDGKANFARKDGIFCQEVNRCLASSDAKDKVKLIEMCVAFFEKLKAFSDQAAILPTIQVWAGESTMSEMERKFGFRDLEYCFDSIEIQKIIQEIDTTSGSFEEKIDNIIRDVKVQKKLPKKNQSESITLDHLNALKNLHRAMREWYVKFKKNDERLYNVVNKLHGYESMYIRGDLVKELVNYINKEVDALSGVDARGYIETNVIKELVAALKSLRDSGKLKFDVKIQLREIKKRFMDLKNMSAILAAVSLESLYCRALDSTKYKEILNDFENLTQ